MTLQEKRTAAMSVDHAAFHVAAFAAAKQRYLAAGHSGTGPSKDNPDHWLHRYHGAVNRRDDCA